MQDYRSAIMRLNDPAFYSEMVKRGLRRNKGNDLDRLIPFLETGVETRHALSEKQEIAPVKEKKVIERPGSKKQKISSNG